MAKGKTWEQGGQVRGDRPTHGFRGRRRAGPAAIADPPFECTLSDKDGLSSPFPQRNRCGAGNHRQTWNTSSPGRRSRTTAVASSGDSRGPHHRLGIRPGVLVVVSIGRSRRHPQPASAEMEGRLSAGAQKSRPPGGPATPVFQILHLTPARPGEKPAHSGGSFSPCRFRSPRASRAAIERRCQAEPVEALPGRGTRSALASHRAALGKAQSETHGAHLFELHRKDSGDTPEARGAPF
jgi:hypothetical protein